MCMKFSENKPFVWSNDQQLIEHLQIQELLKEFEYLMYCERLKEHYSKHKPPKK